jgi:hypothetical protein
VTEQGLACTLPPKVLGGQAQAIDRSMITSNLTALWDIVPHTTSLAVVRNSTVRTNLASCTGAEDRSWEVWPRSIAILKVGEMCSSKKGDLYVD